MTQVVRINRGSLGLYWPEVEKILNLDQAPFDQRKLFQKLLMEERTLWLAVSEHPRILGVIITGQLPRSFLIHLVAGRRGISKWIESALVAIGRVLPFNCEVHVYARKGWMSYAHRFQRATSGLVRFYRDRPTARGRPRKNKINPEVGICRSLAPVTNRATTGCWLR